MSCYPETIIQWVRWQTHICENTGNHVHRGVVYLCRKGAKYPEGTIAPYRMPGRTALSVVSPTNTADIIKRYKAEFHESPEAFRDSPYLALAQRRHAEESQFIQQIYDDAFKAFVHQSDKERELSSDNRKLSDSLEEYKRELRECNVIIQEHAATYDKVISSFNREQKYVRERHAQALDAQKLITVAIAVLVFAIMSWVNYAAR